MEKVIITTDSGLNPIKKETMIPGIIISNNKSYYDTLKIADDDNDVLNGKDALNKVIQGERLSTSAPSLEDYEKVFVKYLKEGYDIVHLATSESISPASVNSPYIIINNLRDKYDNDIYLLNTNTIGTGGTLINLLAEDLKKRGLPAEEIRNELLKIKDTIYSSYYIPELKGYRASGKIPQRTKLLDILAIRYQVIVNKNGELVPKKFYRGNIMKNAYKYIQETINKDNLNNYDSKYIVFLSTILDKIQKETLLNYINDLNYFENIIDENFYGTISAYGVIDQIGIGLKKVK